MDGHLATLRGEAAWFTFLVLGLPVELKDYPQNLTMGATVKFQKNYSVTLD
jgi:hypothetical protein